MQDLRIAAAQFAVPPFDIDAACEAIEKGLRLAAADGVDLVAFPESFLGGYPYWRGNVSVSRESELIARLHEVSVAPTGGVVDELGALAQKYGVSAVVGANVRDSAPGSGTFYNSQLFLSAEHGFVTSRNKIMPTHTERAYWGRGGADDLPVVSFPKADVGALICYEHYMLPARLALALAGSEVHCASWPGYWSTGEHLSDKRIATEVQPYAEVDAVMREHAVSSQNFVVSAQGYLPESVINDDLKDIMGYNVASGGSAVISPSGRYLAGPVIGEEALVAADCTARERELVKAHLDTVGHYARWDIFTFGVAESAQRPDLGHLRREVTDSRD